MCKAPSAIATMDRIRAFVTFVSGLGVPIATQARSFDMFSWRKLPTFLGLALSRCHAKMVAPASASHYMVSLLSLMLEQYVRLASAWRNKGWIGMCQFSPSHSEWSNNEPVEGSVPSRLTINGCGTTPRELHFSAAYHDSSNCTYHDELALWSAAIINSIASFFRLHQPADDGTDAHSQFIGQMTNYGLAERYWFAGEASDRMTSKRPKYVLGNCRAALFAQLRAFSRKIEQACNDKIMGILVAVRCETTKLFAVENRQANCKMTFLEMDYVNKISFAPLLKAVTLLKSAPFEDSAYRASFSQQLIEQNVALERAIEVRNSGYAMANGGGR